MKLTDVVTRFNGFSLWPKVVIGIAAALLATGLAVRAGGALKYMIFGNTEVKRERANTEVAKEQTKAEANIADKTIESVHERDVYREHVTDIVHDGQERVNAADHGQQMDPAIDAAVADGLCSVHDGLCRRPPGAAPLQPVREPVPGED
jgi:hypothetical protein